MTKWLLKKRKKIKCHKKKKKNTHISSRCHNYEPICMCIKYYARNLYMCVVDHDQSFVHVHGPLCGFEKGQLKFKMHCSLTKFNDYSFGLYLVSQEGNEELQLVITFVNHFIIILLITNVEVFRLWNVFPHFVILGFD